MSASLFKAMRRSRKGFLMFAGMVAVIIIIIWAVLPKLPALQDYIEDLLGIGKMDREEFETGVETLYTRAQGALEQKKVTQYEQIITNWEEFHESSPNEQITTATRTKLMDAYTFLLGYYSHQYPGLHCSKIIDPYEMARQNQQVVLKDALIQFESNCLEVARIYTSAKSTRVALQLTQEAYISLEDAVTWAETALPVEGVLKQWPDNLASLCDVLSQLMSVCPTLQTDAESAGLLLAAPSACSAEQTTLVWTDSLKKDCAKVQSSQ